VRKLVLAVFAAWIEIWILALPSGASAQGRGEWQGRGRPQIQTQQLPSDLRRGGGFSGMLRDIAGARLERAHADRRSDRRQGNGNDRNHRRR